MQVIVESRDDFTLENFARVAWEGEAVSLSEPAWDRVARGRAAFVRYLDEHPETLIYGVTTGFGDMAGTLLTPAKREAQARWRGHHEGIGIGDDYPARVVRGIAFARLANFVDGQSGVTPELVREVCDLLSAAQLPRVRRLGQLSSGEVNTLLELFAGLLGERRGSKDANALTNGSPCAAALGADTALRAKNRLDLVRMVFALVIAAGNGPLTAYDSALTSVWASPDEQAALLVLQELLRELPPIAKRGMQPPVSWRIIPRILGEAYRVVRLLADAAERSLVSNTDNPVCIWSDGEEGIEKVLPTGGFHNASIVPAIDAVARTWADIATLTGRHLGKLGRDNLAFEDDPSFYALTGTHAYFAREAREAATPTFLLSEDTYSVQTDVLLPTPHAYEKECRAGRALSCCLAATAALASQNLWYQEVVLAGQLGSFVEQVRELCPPGHHLRRTGFEIERAVEHFEVLVEGSHP